MQNIHCTFVAVFLSKQLVSLRFSLLLHMSSFPFPALTMCIAFAPCNAMNVQQPRDPILHIFYNHNTMLSAECSALSGSIPLTNHTHNAKYGSQPYTKETNQNPSYILSSLKDLWQYYPSVSTLSPTPSQTHI